MWAALSNEADATTLSSTINCTLGIFLAHCGEWNASAATPAAACAEWGCGMSGSCAAQIGSRRACHAYRALDGGALLPRVRRDARTLQPEGYFAQAMRHRFCLAVPGDFLSTPKVTEFVAVGAAGGCVPVVVVPQVATDMLPYADHLDYCSFALLLSARAAADALTLRGVFRLALLPAAAAATMHARLREVRDAFVWRPASDPNPSAACACVRSSSTARGCRGARACLCLAAW